MKSRIETRRGETPGPNPTLALNHSLSPFLNFSASCEEVQREEPTKSPPVTHARFALLRVADDRQAEAERRAGFLAVDHRLGANIQEHMIAWPRREFGLEAGP